jgi:outer membrane protein assembly factor BamD (BamD/ComL family)
MSVSGISSTNFFNSSTQSVQSNMQKFRKEFQQLGQDLQSGNISAAQSDFAALQQMGPQGSSTSSTQSNSRVAQELSQLSQDLQSGNISAAQQDYTTLQQDFQSHTSQAGGHHHHSSSGSDSNSISQLLNQLGQALQTGNLSAAQQAYATMQQTMQQFDTSGTASTTPQASGSVAASA